jgi:glucose-6-phosphate 1-dehydrogenase
VIFGGTGNLAETKLLPALFHLFIQKMLPLSFTLVGLSRRDLSHEAYQDFVRNSILAKSPDSDPSALQEFCNRARFVSGSFSDGQSYIRIKEELLRFDASIGQCTSKLFYLAVPPEYYREIFENIKQSEAMALCDGIGSWARILVEKPFGSDLKTAEHLETQLQESFTEDQVYRIDHYLAKDAIENIISLRFANSILADSWDGSRIESISISLFESQDVSTRGSFYDGIGALRDVGQNHMLQMLALLTMSPADVHDALSVRKSRLAAIRSFVMYDTDVRIRGQYQGYKETVGVHPESDTETYFKVSTHIDSELWKDVAVTLEAGKALHTSLTEAVITFRSTDQCMCAPQPEMHAHRNVLRISFSPEQSIRLTMWVKEPGFDFKLHERELVLATQEGEVFRSPEAYERVLYDCIIGDQTRFVSGEEVVAAWNFITPLLDSLKREPLREYAKGSHAPIIIT